MLIANWPYQTRGPIDPDAILDYEIDWSDWLEIGEVIVDATWTVTGAEVEASSFTSVSAKVWLKNATGKLVQATVHITTNSLPVARQDDRTLIIPVKQR